MSLQDSVSVPKSFDQPKQNRRSISVESEQSVSQLVDNQDKSCRVTISALLKVNNPDPCSKSMFRVGDLPREFPGDSPNSIPPPYFVCGAGKIDVASLYVVGQYNTLRGTFNIWPIY